MPLKTRVRKLERAAGTGEPSVVVTMNIGGLREEDIIGAEIGGKFFARLSAETMLDLKSRLEASFSYKVICIRWIGRQQLLETIP